MTHASPVIVQSRVFELRTYHVAPGKYDELLLRFHNHTLGLFQKHGMTLLGFWAPTDPGKGAGDTLVYILTFNDRAAADAAWASFRADPEWQRVLAESQKNGPLTTSIDSVFMTATDLSPLR